MSYFHTVGKHSRRILSRKMNSSCLALVMVTLTRSMSSMKDKSALYPRARRVHCRVLASWGWDVRRLQGGVVQAASNDIHHTFHQNVVHVYRTMHSLGSNGVIALRTGCREFAKTVSDDPQLGWKANFILYRVFSLYWITVLWAGEVESQKWTDGE